MFGRARPQGDRDQSTPTLPLAPFEAGSLRAEWTPRPYGRRGRTRPFVQLTTYGVDADFHVEDLRRLVEHRQGIAEAMTQPLTFLCWPDSAAPTSIAADQLLGVPPDSLALLVDPMLGPPAFVLDRTGIAAFTAWLDTLPA